MGRSVFGRGEREKIQKISGGGCFPFLLLVVAMVIIAIAATAATADAATKIVGGGS